MDEEVIDFEEIEFNGAIRSQVICLLLFISLYFISYGIILHFKTKTDYDELYAGDEDFFVYRISVWMCTGSLAISIGAVFLLPISMLGTEVLHLYPDNYYLKWFNWSLINSLWSYVFLFSNVSLFFLLPFAYFFIESQGFSFQQQRPKPFLSRVYETICVCILVIIILISLAHVFYSLFLSEKLSVNFSIFNLSGLSIPLIYSFGSLVGVFLLLLSAPLGFATMFDKSSKLLLNNNKDAKTTSLDATDDSTIANNDYQTRTKSNESPLTRSNTTKDGGPYGDFMRVRTTSSTSPDMLQTSTTGQFVLKIFSRIRRLIKASIYPLSILLLLLLTGISVFMVFINTLQLLFGFRVLPGYVQIVEVHSRHKFGIFGAVVESIIIMYIMMSALCGVYSIPLLKRMQPERSKTSMTCVIVNCTMILLLSSALPVLARTLGITSFDLLGSYGRLNWISNVSLVYIVNIVFAAASSFSLLNKFTAQVRIELRKRVFSLYKYKKEDIDKKMD